MRAVLLGLVWGGAALAQNAVGMNAHLPADDELDALQALGVSWVRIDNNWFVVEARQGAPDWRELDRVVDGAVARGLQVFMTVAYTPEWASAGDTDGTFHNDVPRPGTYDAYVRATVTRYADRVTHYGIWNEPNLDHFFEGTLDQYVDAVLRPGAAAVKAACPACLVLGPDLAGVSEWQAYLAPVMERAGDVLDIVTHHTYAAAGGVRPGIWACDNFEHAMDNQTPICFYKPGLRQILDQAGWDGDVWLTETGYRADPWDAAGQQQNQVRTAEAILAMQLERPWWTHTFFYELTDCRPAQPECEIDGYGFLRRQAPVDGTWADNFVVKPVFDWLREELGENPEWGAAPPDPPEPPPEMPRRILAPQRPAGMPDGQLADWDDRGCVVLLRYEEVEAPRRDAGDLSARACAAWSADALWLAVEAVDDVFAEGQEGALWLGDSVQLAVDVDADAAPGAGFDDDDLEWTLALFEGAPRVVAEHGVVAATGGVTRDGVRTRYELRAPLPGLVEGRTLRASFLVNDNDGAGRKGWLEWTPGIGREKAPALYGEITLEGRAATPPDGGPGPEPDAAPPPPLPTPPDAQPDSALDAGMPEDGAPDPVLDAGADAQLADAQAGADGSVASTGGDGGCAQGDAQHWLWLSLLAGPRRRRGGR